MVFNAVLDANALYPFSLRDTLLRLAELELYTPLWSDRILEEMRRNLVERQITDEQASKLIAAMRDAFEEAEVDAAEIERLEPAMTNDPKDHHVLAAAVAAGSELIVTFNLDDFALEACEPLGVEAIHPDSFLLDLHDLSPDRVRAALEQQAADLNPPWPLDQLLDALQVAGGSPVRRRRPCRPALSVAPKRPANDPLSTETGQALGSGRTALPNPAPYQGLRGRGMERLWSLAVATSGNRWQMGTPQERLKQAKTVATCCDQLPIGAHGKEGVDGSSPSEGFTKAPANGAFLCLNCKRLSLAGTL